MLKKWIENLSKKYRVEGRVRWLIIKAKSTSLPFFDGVPIYDVLYFIHREITRDDIVTRANSMAYSFFLALFPFLLVMLSLMYYLPIDFDIDGYIDSLPEVIPEEASETFRRLLSDVLEVPRGGVLSLGFILALFFSSNGMKTMMKGFDKAHEESFVSRSFWTNQLMAIYLTLLMGLLFLASLILIVFGNLLIDFIFADLYGWGYQLVIRLFKWVGVIVLFFGGISTIYFYGPSLKTRFRFFSPGATLATGLSLLTSLLFSFYVDNFAQYSEIYGSIGAFLIILIWLQLNCLILLLGFELNASIRVNKDLRSG
ncbi:MAG: YihY/virulence factor BrkB family protein [Saprospirales bacterium]|nr:MAG: YihY/virulence factor BrkB family protein [Saprospirales bacterium]